MSHGRSRTSVALIAALTLAAAATIAFAGPGATLSRSSGCRVLDNVVEVVVANPGDSPATYAVEVQAVVDGELTSSYASVSLEPGETAVASVVFGGSVESVVTSSVIRLGEILDGPSPF
jgi:uncharacterized protein (DUF58 family)